jgi:hypothetical protein
MNIWLLGPRFRGDERRLWLRMYPPHCVALFEILLQIFGELGANVRGERAFDTLPSSALTARQRGCDQSLTHSHICLVQSALIIRPAAEPKNNIRKRSKDIFHV